MRKHISIFYAQAHSYISNEVFYFFYVLRKRTLRHV